MPLGSGIHAEQVCKREYMQPPIESANLTNNLQLTRNLSADEIANVNFLYDDIVHALQNTIDTCINSATDRRSYVLELMFTKFSEITQYKGHYTVQGHSRSSILLPIESSCTTSFYYSLF